MAFATYSAIFQTEKSIENLCIGKTSCVVVATKKRDEAGFEPGVSVVAIYFGDFDQFSAKN
jgi:hypothetical protein